MTNRFANLGLGNGELRLLAEDIAVQDIDQPEYHHVLWWHVCHLRDTWVPAGMSAHDVTGSVAGDDLTINPSILCRTCQRHGFVTAMKWVEA